MTRGSGVLLHITSLPSRCGIGDLGPAAYAFAENLSRSGQQYWQILPLNPTNQGAGNSPYFSMSAFAGNPMHISPEMLVEDGWLPGDLLGSMPEWTVDAVDFGAVETWKTKLLSRCFARLEGWIEQLDRFDSFCAANREWLEDFAVFMVIKRDQGNRPWPEWPTVLRDREPASLNDIRFSRAAAIRETMFQQYLVHEQWSRLRRRCTEIGVALVGDVPIYIALDSADVWSNPDLFKLDPQKQPTAVSGVPPDYFSETGQLWNTPVYDWDALSQTGFQWWKHRMGRMFSLYDIVRIDHFRGLVQYWEVPAGEETAIYGAWRDVPSIPFFDALKSSFPDFSIIAEDLGVITEDVVEVMDRYHFPGMKVLVFAFGSDDPEHIYLPHNYPRNSVVYTGTHDTNTLVGWWQEEAKTDEQHRVFRYIGRDVGEKELSWEVLRIAMSSVADMAIFPLQDILGLPASARMNDPSTASGNWGWRCTPEEMGQVDWGRLGEMTRVYGRGGPESGKW